MTTTSKPWREILDVHPAADLLPLMGEAELRELADDIKAQGHLIDPVTVMVGGPEKKVLLDGRNRLDALALLGWDIVDEHGELRGNLYNLLIDLPGATAHWAVHDPYRYVLSANVRRRHLTAEQKREVVTKLLKGDPTKSNRQIAKLVQVDHKTVAAVRAKAEAGGEIPHVTTTVGGDGKSYRAKQAIKHEHHEPVRDPDDATKKKPSHIVSKSAGVMINSGPIEATQHLDSVPELMWVDLMRVRRDHLHTRLNYDCRCLAEFIEDAQIMHAKLGFASARDLVRDGFHLEPDEASRAVDVIQRLLKSKQPPLIIRSEAMGPVDRCTSDVRALVLRYLKGMEPNEFSPLIATLREEIDDLEEVAERRKQDRSAPVDAVVPK